MSTPDLTLLSVRYGSSAALELNVSLTAALNPGAAYGWLVVDNGPASLETGLEGARVIPGAPPIRQGDRGSYHHAAGLMLGLEAVKTRYLCLVDHDFFVIYPDWMGVTLEHMAQRDLSFFGAVWHPRWSYQYRGFPSVHFLLVDLERAPPETLDFRPDMGGDPWDRLVSSKRLPLPSSLRTLLQVGRFRDTGFRVQRRFRHWPERFECLTPHFDFSAAWRAAPPLHRLAHRLLPEASSPLPKRPDSFTAESFLKTLSPLGYGLGWEEFFWRDQPFGFHLRGVGRSADSARDLEEAARLVTALRSEALTEARQSSRRPLA